MKYLIAVLLMFSSAVGFAKENDFPTLARTEYVVACMNKLGEQSYDNLYHCVCAVDKIAERMAYEDYNEARTFTMLRRTPGEKGGVFRDPPRAKELRAALSDAVDYAEASCL